MAHFGGFIPTFMNLCLMQSLGILHGKCIKSPEMKIWGAAIYPGLYKQI